MSEERESKEVGIAKVNEWMGGWLIMRALGG